jgi:hypothetical protein
MIFSISADSKSISRFASSWNPRELDVEGYIFQGAEDSEGLLNSAVLGEPLLLVKRQVETFQKKRADILAVDRQGNGVIIELKRDAGAAGVETQALQYLASFAPFAGRDFISRFSPNPTLLEDRVRGFLGDIPLEQVNRRHRIILVARTFDRTLFSMGKWFGSNGVAFRCIEYTPVEIEGRRFISFSVAFDQAPPEVFPFAFSNSLREPQTFWHNIGDSQKTWWNYLCLASQIPASWDNEPNDPGEQLLRSYVIGDRVIAYGTGVGALGWGVIERVDYKLIPLNSADDVMGGKLRHRLRIKWKSVAADIAAALPSHEIREGFGIYHPISTSVKIDSHKADKLVAALSARFGPCSTA